MAVEERYACVMLHNPQITFKIWLNEGILPEIWPAERERQHRAVKADPVAMMEQRYGVTGADRKTLVAVISTITGLDARYLGMPSQGYQIGDYLVDMEGTLTGPESADLIAALAAKGYEAKKKKKKNNPASKVPGQTVDKVRG